MYSRFPARREPAPERFHLPEHYSGCAFSALPPPERAEEPPHAPQAPQNGENAAVSSHLPLPPPCPPIPSCEPCSPSPEPTRPKPGEDLLHSLFGGSFPALPGSPGFEELLLLGLILLLGRNEESPDIILWLALLLFCK